MQIKIDMKQIIRQSVKESIKETMGVELLKLRAELLSYVSAQEQTDIETTYGKPGEDVAESPARWKCEMI